MADDTRDWLGKRLAEQDRQRRSPLRLKVLTRRNAPTASGNVEILQGVGGSVVVRTRFGRSPVTT